MRCLRHPALFLVTAAAILNPWSWPDGRARADFRGLNDVVPEGGPRRPGGGPGRPGGGGGGRPGGGPGGGGLRPTGGEGGGAR